MRLVIENLKHCRGGYALLSSRLSCTCLLILASTTHTHTHTHTHARTHTHERAHTAKVKVVSKCRQLCSSPQRLVQAGPHQPQSGLLEQPGRQGPGEEEPSRLWPRKAGQDESSPGTSAAALSSSQRAGPGTGRSALLQGRALCSLGADAVHGPPPHVVQLLGRWSGGGGGDE